jgi:hypothetical protein
MPFDVNNKFRDAGYQLQNTIYWIKSISIRKEVMGKSNGKRDDYSVGPL